MRIKERQKRYGFLLGVLAFLAGWGTLYVLAPSLNQESIPRWLEVTWMYLSAHYVEISGLQLSGLGGLGSQVDFVGYLEIPLARAIPPLMLAIVGILANDIIGYSTKIAHLAKNSASVLTGYAIALLVAYLLSMANPGVALLLIAIVIGFGALYLGSTLVNQVGGIPIFGITSLGALAVIGLIVLIAGVSLVIDLWPAFVVMAGTVIVVTAVMYSSRNAPT